jgi:sodium transport system permease protein
MLSMGLTTWKFSTLLVHNPFHLSIIVWGLVLVLPLSAFFSALCLAVGVYARSSKEGQYYLMPLFLLTMPLIFLTLAPGVELNPFYSMVPVTGVALLLQSLMVSGTPSWSHVLYFVPVLAPMVIYSWLALRWAIEQFQREEVLFREAERLEVGLWLKKLFRDKERLPSTGQALFCFGLILALRWLSFNVGQDLPLLVRTAISHLAFVATPPLFMVLLLTTRPFQGLGFRLPPWWAWLAATLLGVLVMPPISELTLYILHQVPALYTLLEQYHPLTSELQKLVLGGDTSLGNRLRFLLVLGLLPALCEELAFRGFILTGLSRRFRPWTAVLLSSFLFALYQMNVFQFVPHFIFGVILALLVLRTGSVLTAMVFHLVYNCLLMLPFMFPTLSQIFAGTSPKTPGLPVLRVVLSVVCTLLAFTVLLAIWRVSRWQTPAPHSDGDMSTSFTLDRAAAPSLAVNQTRQAPS